MADYGLENRKYIIGGVATAIVTIYIIRLFVLQIMSDDYRQSADSNAFFKNIQYPSRGVISDRNGELLVYNEPSYDLMVIMNEQKGHIDTLEFCKALGITPEFYEQRASEIDATTEKAIKQNQAIMKKIEDDIRQAYSKAIENAKRLEDESFAKLKDESQKRTSACLDEVEAQTKQITAIIDSRISETQKSLDDKTKIFSDSLKEQTSAIEEKFNERTQRISEMIDARTNVLTGTWTEKIESLEQDLKESSENFDSRLEDAVLVLIILLLKKLVRLKIK